MKIIEDDSVFDLVPPEPFRVNGEILHYQVSRTKKSAVRMLHEAPEWAAFWVSAVFQSELYAGAHLRREGKNFLAIEFVREGELYFRQEGRSRLVEAGEVCLMHPGKRNEFLVASKLCRKTSLTVYGSLLTGFLEKSGLAEQDVLCGIDTLRLSALIGRLDSGEAVSPESHCLLSFETLQLLARRQSPSVPPKALENLAFIMAAHPERSYRLDDLARRYGCSVPVLIRLFREHFHDTPHRYLTRIRMRLAAQILQEQDLSIKETAGMVGYGNALNFSTEFKKYHHCSPRDYRRRRS